MVQFDGEAASGGQLASLGEKLLKGLSVPERYPGQARQIVGSLSLSTSTLSGLFFIAVISALCGTAIIHILNSEAKRLEDGDYSAFLVILFVLVLIAYRITQQRLIAQTGIAIEQALHKWRVRISEKVGKLSIRDIETIGRGSLEDGLAKHYEQLSQTIVPLVAGFESIILLAFMLVYLFSLSVTAAGLTVFVAVLLVLGYLSTSAVMKDTMVAAAKADAQLTRLTSEVIDGFKELRLDRRKRDALYSDVCQASFDVANLRARSADILSKLITTANSASYLLAASVVFALPVLTGSGGSEISHLITAVLFLLGPIGGVVGAVQQFTTAQFTVNAISGFEREIDNFLPLDNEQVNSSNPPFRSLVLTGICYSHNGSNTKDNNFSIRDVSLSLEPGRIIFISGANGSGKTTALRVLTGLYPRQAGHIELNGEAVDNAPPQAYRNYFSCVFGDYHVFRRPYGLDDRQVAIAEKMLDYFKIREKLPDDFSAGYDPSQLSTGQRKRLALALALAEERPILILDEWAADQDPKMREKFYLEVLPRIKAEGKAVIAVTHDDRYFSVADARYHMEDGRIVALEQS